jgi:hypothetical protein
MLDFLKDIIIFIDKNELHYNYKPPINPFLWEIGHILWFYNYFL